MNWNNLTTYVVSKTSSGSSASTPVVGENVYFELHDKGMYKLYETSAITNSKGAAILNNVSGGNMEEYWYSFIYRNGRGIPTEVKTMNDNVATITIIESASTSTWENLSVFVGQRNGYSGVTPINGTMPLSSANVYFQLQGRGRPVILSGITNKIGYATVSNNGLLNDVLEWSAGTTYNNNYYASDRYEISTTEGSIIITDTAPPKDDEQITRLTVFTKRSSNNTSIEAYVVCFLYDINGNYKYKLTGNTTIEEGLYRIDFNIQQVPSYTLIKQVKINAYNSNYNIAYISSNFETLNYDSETGHSFTAYLSTQEKGYSGKITQVNSYDLLYYYLNEDDDYGANPWTFRVTLAAMPYTTLISAYENAVTYPSSQQAVITFNSSTSPYVIFESSPDDNSYYTGKKQVNLLDYPFDSTIGSHLIGTINIYCAKARNLQIENPVVIDTEEKDLDSPVFNLPNVTMTYKYIFNGSEVWSCTSSSNSEYTTFNIPQDIEGGVDTFIKTLAGRTQHKVTRTLSKHQYDDITTYVFVSASTIPISYGSQEMGQMFFYFCKYTSENGNITRFYMPQRYLYIKREEDVCYRTDMFNDYVRGFDYEYNGNVITAISYNDNTVPADRSGDTPRSGEETVFPIVSAFTLTPDNKIIVARKEFYSGCAVNVSPNITPIPQTVTNYKNFFVSPAISRVEYLTKYANLPDPENQIGNDMFFDVDSNIYSAHSYTEHLQSFWPVAGQWWNYLEFYPTGSTTGSVTLVAENMELQEQTTTLQYSYWGDRWEYYKIGTTIELLQGTNVRFRNAQNVTSFSWVEENGQGLEDDVEKYYHFVVEGDKMCVKGNLSSLINVSGRGYTVTGEYSFLKLFYESNIYYAKNLIVDPLTVTEGCYYNMFRGCTNLIAGPDKIQTTSGGLGCMGHMFHGCSEMVSGPTRIKLRDYPELCCDHMFTDCTKLEYPPMFTYNTQSNTFGEACFGQMFLDCISLKEPTSNPDQIYSIEEEERDSYGCGWQLGDTVGGLIVGDASCYEMFKGCSSLKTTPIFQPFIVSENGCFSMFSACTNLTNVKFSMPFERSIVEENGCAYMFDNCWSIYTLANVALSATELSDKCYFHMFDTCYDLHGALPCIQATIIPPSGCAYMYRDCFNDRHNYVGYLNQFITEDFQEVGNFGMAHMFERCQNMDFNIGKRDLYHIPTNTRIGIKSENTIANAYEGYIKAEQKPGDEHERYYAYVMLDTGGGLEVVCIGTVDMYSPYFNHDNTLDSSLFEFRHSFNYLNLRAKQLNDSCYSHMFSACTGLHYANHFVLDANVLADKCYEYMFCSCSNLFAIPLCFSGITSYAASACQYMFAYDSDFKVNNKIMNLTPQSTWHKYQSEFNYIYPACGQTAYEREYYLYKNGLRSIQRRYNYHFSKFGGWLRNDESSSSYAYVDSNGENYNTISSESYNLIDVDVLKDISLKTNAYNNAYNCFSHMFYACKGLKESYFDIFNTFIRESMFESMFNCCYSLKKAPIFNIQTESTDNVQKKGCYRMFKDCHELLNLGCNNIRLKSTEIGDYAYYMMYNGCYKIITGPRIDATNLGIGAMAHMFNCCYRLTGLTHSTLPSTTLNEQCYYGMFGHCFSLQNAPTLPATILSADCYSYMFNKACLYYYTGYTRYKIHATLHNDEQQNCPDTACGKCSLTEYSIVDDTGHNTLDTDWKMQLEYFGNYFYNFSSFQYSKLDLPGNQVILPEPYDVYASPYGNLTNEKYFREDTELDEGFEPHVTNTSELLVLINKYFRINTRNILTKNHTYTWEKGADSGNVLKVLKRLLPDGQNPYIYDEDGLPNDEIIFDRFTGLTKEINVTKSGGGSFPYDFPYFLDNNSINSLNDSLETESGATTNFVKKLYKKYKVYMRYRVDRQPEDQQTSSGYSLNYSNDDIYLENKEIRDERWYTYHTEYENGRFFIPVNDRSEVWNHSLSSVTISSNYLTNYTAKGMLAFLNLVDGTLHAPGPRSNYSDVLPTNWSKST